MKRIKAFGVARLVFSALLAVAVTCLTACGESRHADNVSLNKMAESGQRIVQDIITAETSKRYMRVAWPSDEAGRYSGYKPANGPDMYQSFASTADYFTEALYLEETDAERRARLKVLQGIQPADLVADGYEEATGSTIYNGNCAWRIALNARRAPGKTPVLVSRNVNVEVLCNTPVNDISVGADELLLDIPPFGKSGCVIVYRDGSVQTFSADEIGMPSLVPLGGNGKLSDIMQGDDSLRFLP